MKLDALGKVPGDDLPVIVLGVELTTRGPISVVLHQDGSMSIVPLEKVMLNIVETAVRFDQLETTNTRLVEEARELGNE